MGLVIHLTTALFLLSAFVLSGPQDAMAGPKGILSTVSYQKVAEKVAFAIQTLDDSDDNVILREDFVEAMERKGYKISADARYVITLETSTQEGTWTGSGRSKIVRLGNAADHSGTDAPDVRVSIFDSSEDGLFSGKRKRRFTQVAASTLRIDAQIDDRQNGKRVWQGWAQAEVASAGEDLTLSKSMIRPLIENLGKTVRQKQFQLY